MLKKLLISACLVVSLSLSSFAAFPQEINYQGKLLDSGGAPLTGSYSILFAIYDAPSGGANLWSETQSVSVEAGIFNVLLGSVTPITTEAFDGSNRWLGIKVGADAEMTPRHKLVSVGNAFHAYNADKLDGHDWSEVPSVDNVVLLSPPSIQSTSAAYAIQVETSASTGTAVYGLASSTGGVTNYGGSFKANGDLGYGVFGDASGSDGKGVVGRSSGANGYGIYGVSTGSGYSGYFTGGNGVRVNGTVESAAGGFKFPDGTIQTTAASGGASGNVVLLGPLTIQSTSAAYAVNLETTASSGTCIAGAATATGAVTNYGGVFEASGNSGRGVSGFAWATGAVTNYGGSFQAGGDSGYGVFGDASGSSGKGVGGRSSGANGYGIYGVHTGSGYSGYFTGGKGVRIIGSLEAETAEPTGIAVYGVASATGAVTNYGGIFEAYGDAARAVEGYAYSTGGSANYGGSFTADGAAGYGVYGEANGTSGKGVGGRSSGANGYGIYGENTSTGYSGYFTGGKGVRVVGTIESTAGGFKFPDGTIQTTAASGGATGDYVLKTGDAMTGPLTFEGVTYDITTVSNQHLALMPNGTGRVGVGTISPAEKLHVAGTIKADNTFYGTNLYLMQNGQDVLLTLYGDGVGVEWTIGNEDSQNGDLIFSNSGNLASPKVTITQPQGRVGIGTSSPTNLLTVAGTIESRNGEIYLDNSNIRILRDDAQDLLIKFDGQNNGIPWTIGQDDSGNGDFVIANQDSLDSKRMLTILESSGRVGIGTTAPTSLLTVTGTIESTIGGIKFPDGTLQTTAASGGATGNYVLFAPTSAQATVAAYPVWVETSNSSGRAVYGRATSTGGSSIGGYFETASIGGSAVYGEANGTNATAISGSADGDNGKAIYGSAGGDGHAGYFDGNLYVNGLATIETNVLGGRAVYGRATNTSGTNYGGYFRAAGANGIAVLGSAESTGVGTKSYGGYFTTRSRDGHAVYGESIDTNLNSDGCGGYFKTAGGDGYAVYAENTYPNEFGISTGVIGIGYNNGVIGSTESGAGVTGHATGDGGKGVWGYNDASGGTGVSGLAAGSFGKAIAGEGVGGAYAGWFFGNVAILGGSIEVTYMPTTASGANVYYNTTTNYFYRSTSSKRYKDNIKPFLTDFNLILKAEPKSFTDKASTEQNVGFIAEEFDEIGLKELINYDEQGRPDSLKYDRVPLYLLEVIKGQQKEIKELKSRLEAIESKLK